MIAEYILSILTSWGLNAAGLFFLPRVFISLVCGTIIGSERELFNKVAGMKTLMLVCLGSTLFATISMFVGQKAGVDETRIIGQIVTGIGFLGAGVILQSKNGVYGMTSAANIWFTGAVGCVIGIGEYELAIMLSIISIVFLISFRFFEVFFNRSYNDSKPRFYHLKIEAQPEVELYMQIQKIIKSNNFKNK
jgi:putative Mg2+ transporter-C (MgtC) family protein